MMFDYPFVLFAFAVFIPLFLYDIFGSSRKFRRNLPETLVKKQRFSVIFFRLFLAFAVIALAGPRWGTGFSSREYRRGLDMVFAIDVSRSMDIHDAQSDGVIWTRLDRGLLIAGETITAVSGARFAAAIGRGKGFLAVPLTWDNETALSFLASLNGSYMTGRSTNLEALVDAAAGAFQTGSPAKKVIVLVSDGESLLGVLKNALNRCVREGIIVNTVALGSDEGRPLPKDPDVSQNAGVISKRDTAVMRTTAERTGGIYVDGNREDASSILSAHLLSISQETDQGEGKKEPKERRSLFIILAIIAYGGSKFVRRLLRLPVLSILAMVLTMSSCSEGRMLLLEANYLSSRGRYDEAVLAYSKALNFKEAAPYAEYGLGLTYHSLEEGKAALKRYADSQKMIENHSAEEHRELRYRNNYNSGIVFFEEGEYHSAASAFKEALRTDPQRMEAKHNLELSLMSITRNISEENRNETQRGNETREILFEYLGEKEQQQWKSREWAPDEEPIGADY
jgi:Ca-activated chloride channel family protein